MVTFDDTSNFRIKPLADTGTVFLFDTANNVTATIIQKSVANILGVNDSIKTILLSTGDTIIISKNFGFLQFQYGILKFYLIGKESVVQSWGFTNPVFYDFFNIGEVGDIFQYHSSGWNEGGFGSMISDIKKTIIEKYDYTDSITYIFDVLQLSHDTFWLQVNYLNYTDTVTFIDSASNFCNSYNGQIAEFHDENFYPVVDFYCPVYISTDDSNRIIKRTCYEEPSQFYGTNFYLPDTSNPNQMTYYEMYQYYIKQIKKGLGYTYEGGNQFSGSYYIKLIGYIKNNDTTGTVYPDSYLTGVDRYWSHSEFYIYPNPATDNLTISITNYELRITSVSIYNVMGKQVLPSLQFVPTKIRKGGKADEALNQQIASPPVRNDEIRVSISTLSAGIYFVKVGTNQGTVVKKFVKQ